MNQLGFGTWNCPQTAIPVSESCLLQARVSWNIWALVPTTAKRVWHLNLFLLCPNLSYLNPWLKWTHCSVTLSCNDRNIASLFMSFYLYFICYLAHWVLSSHLGTPRLAKWFCLFYPAFKIASMWSHFQGVWMLPPHYFITIVCGSSALYVSLLA